MVRVLPGRNQRLRYLNDAAYSLASTSPAVSAHLMAQYNLCVFGQELEQSAARKREVCGACGNIMIPGLTSKSQLYSEKLSKRKIRKLSRNEAPAPPEDQPRAKEMRHHCQLCGRITREVLQQQPRRQKASTLVETPLVSASPGEASEQLSPSPLATSTTPTPTPVPANAQPSNVSSRKRAKARKQGGLQAILAKHKENEASKGSGIGGLDLMDFMKSG